MEAFYELSSEDRAQMTVEAISQRKTLMFRWKNLAASESAPWQGRAGVAAAFIAEQPSVADMGCGMMGLEMCLSPSVHYVPVDVVARDERTVVVDFNLQAPPITDARCAACLGLLEYLFDVPRFLAELSKRYDTAVISYNITDAPSPLSDRLSHAWVNKFSRSDIAYILEHSGWTIEKDILFDDREYICLAVLSKERVGFT